MPAKAEVELDVYSGMPNPMWTLQDTDMEQLVKRLAALPRAPAVDLSGNLGYRGLVVRITDEDGSRLARIQQGLVRISKSAEDVYARDANRALERWLLETGRPHLERSVIDLIDREVR